MQKSILEELSGIKQTFQKLLKAILALVYKLRSVLLVDCYFGKILWNVKVIVNVLKFNMASLCCSNLFDCLGRQTYLCSTVSLSGSEGM